MIAVMCRLGLMICHYASTPGSGRRLSALLGPGHSGHNVFGLAIPYNDVPVNLSASPETLVSTRQQRQAYRSWLDK